ncbi:MAG: glycosyltransferase family 4 protein [Acidobacteriota bacterium]
MRIRICHIITKLELGGAQQNTLYTVSHLDKRRFDPVLICGTGGILDEEARKLEGVRVYFLPSLVRSVNPIKDPKVLLEIQAILKREAPDIVHTHSSKAGILGRWGAFLADVPVIIHSIHGFGFHNEQSFLKRNLFIVLERMTSKITTKFIAVSSDNIKTGKLLGILSDGQTVLIRSGIKLADFCHSNSDDGMRLRQRSGIPSEAPLVGMASCFKPQKSPVDFVNIAAQLIKQVKDAYFLMAGDGELRFEIEEEIKKNSLEGRILLLGWNRDMPSFMRAIDVLVLTSLWEGLPRVIPEAFASGKPVVATAVDGAKDVIQDGKNGFLLAPHDINGFASRIAMLLKNKDLSRRFAKEGKKMLDDFDIDMMVRKQEDLYLSLTSRAA